MIEKNGPFDRRFLKQKCVPFPKTQKVNRQKDKQTESVNENNKKKIFQKKRGMGPIKKLHLQSPLPTMEIVLRNLDR